MPLSNGRRVVATPQQSSDNEDESVVQSPRKRRKVSFSAAGSKSNVAATKKGMARPALKGSTSDGANKAAPSPASGTGNATTSASHRPLPEKSLSSSNSAWFGSLAAKPVPKVQRSNIAATGGAAPAGTAPRDTAGPDTAPRVSMAGGPARKVTSKRVVQPGRCDFPDSALSS